MKLTLRNLGGLREATIDLDKDLILLTGPNNTSKTYVAHALYGFGKNYLSSLGPVLLTALRGFVVSSPEAVPLLKVDLVELVDQCLPQMLEQLARNYRRELVNVLAASEEFVARTEVFLEVGEAQIARGKRILRDLVDTDELKLFGADELYAIRKAKGDPVWTFGRILPTLPSAERPASFELKADSIWLMYAAGYIAGVLSRALFRVSEPYILTAERAAIQLFSRELSLNRTELVDSLLQIKSSGERQSQVGAAVLGTLEQRAQRYPLAIRDSRFAMVCVSPMTWLRIGSCPLPSHRSPNNSRAGCSAVPSVSMMTVRCRSIRTIQVLA